MPNETLWPSAATPTSALASRIGEIEATTPFDTVLWRMLKTQLAESRSTDIADVAGKLHVVLNGIQSDADDIRILRSAIDDLVVLSRTP